MATLKQASRERVEQIENDARQLVQDEEEPQRFREKRVVNNAARELHRRGEEL